MTRIMFFDAAITGHHTEYIGHLVKYIPENTNGADYYFVVNQDFIKNFDDIKILADSNPAIKIIEITPEEYKAIYSTGSLIVRSINEFRIMNSYAIKFNIDQCFLLSINSFQFALGLYKTKYTINGILFGQYTWQVFPGNLKGWLNKKRKVLLTMFFLRNRKLKSIFLLNDDKSCHPFNEFYKTNVFKYLPDPVAELQAEPFFDLKENYNIPSNHKVYLHVGSLGPRKGTLDILDSVKYLDENIRLNISIIIVGKAANSFDQLIKKKIEEITANFKVSIIYENAYVANNRLKSIFEQIDFILIPYKNTESSGILGHAIINKKLVIGPGTGLLGYLIADNKLGYLLNHVNSASIAEAITDSFYTSPKYVEDKIRRDYLSTHTSNIFANTILSQL
jgi:glycosyltransferase involved in cell wall biosynthesis